MAINKELLDIFERLYPMNTFVRAKREISCLKSKTEHFPDARKIECGELVLIKEYVEFRESGNLCVIFIDKDLKERITGYFYYATATEELFECI